MSGKDAKVIGKPAKKRKKPKKFGYFGLAPIRRLAHSLGYKRVSKDVLRLVNAQIEGYAKMMLEGCAEMANNVHRSTLTEKDFRMAMKYCVKSPLSD